MSADILSVCLAALRFRFSVPFGVVWTPGGTQNGTPVVAPWPDERGGPVAAGAGRGGRRGVAVRRPRRELVARRPRRPDDGHRRGTAGPLAAARPVAGGASTGPERSRGGAADPWARRPRGTGRPAAAGRGRGVPAR